MHSGVMSQTTVMMEAGIVKLSVSRAFHRFVMSHSAPLVP